MANFTSKVQYKTYEKGEFSDEQPRGLEDTLTLIKSFPWDTQRGVDVQLTGPGVAIEGSAGDYLKIGTYFNNKFALYYLDNTNHLYEFHTDNMDVVCEKVAEFFKISLSLDGFEKHTFSIGSKSHFIDGAFWHTINKSRELFQFTLISIFIVGYVGGVFIAFIAGAGIPAVFLIGVLLFASALIPQLLRMLRIYNRAKNISLWLAQGHNDFIFCDGDTEQHLQKTDVKEINVYGHYPSRGRAITMIIEVVFKDDNVIRFPAMLMDPYEFLRKMGNEITVNNITQSSSTKEARKAFLIPY